MITLAQARKIKDAIREMYSEYAEYTGTTPNLRDHEHETLHKGAWSIDWEDGPEGWAIHLADQPNLIPAAQGAHLEAIYSYVLGVFPA